VTRWWLGVRVRRRRWWSSGEGGDMRFVRLEEVKRRRKGGTGSSGVEGTGEHLG